MDFLGLSHGGTPVLHELNHPASIGHTILRDTSIFWVVSTAPRVGISISQVPPVPCPKGEADDHQLRAGWLSGPGGPGSYLDRWSPQLTADFRGTG